MKLTLDSSVLIDVLRGQKLAVRERLEAAQSRGDDLNVSSIVVHELAAGAMLSQKPDLRLRQVGALLADIPPVEFTPDDALAAARVRADLERAGRRIGSLDLLIAGQAVARGWTLVTGNLKHFVGIGGLPLMDWTISDQPLDQAKWAARPSRAQED